MLRIRMADRLLNRLDAGLGDDYGAAVRSNRLHAIRSAVERIVARVDKAREPRPANGRAALIQAIQARQAEGFARDISWVLEGVLLRSRLPLSDRPPLPFATGLGCASLDGDAYICAMIVGPPDARKFRDDVCLLLYLHLTCCAYVCWIGPQDEIAQGLRFVHANTSDLTDFGIVDPAYQAALVTLGRRRGCA